MSERMFTLGARLQACADYVRNGSRIADIGTDHAYLPVWLVCAGISPSAIASDINTGPIEEARRNIERYEVSDKITTMVADGLSALSPNDADDIIIAGMGGELIADILSRADWLRDARYRLILQPMTHAERLREYLCRGRFVIEDERAVCDGRRVYTVICASYSGKEREYLPEDIYIGGLAGKTDDDARRYLSMQARLIRTQAHGLRISGDEKHAQLLENIARKMEG